jgi:hypothetical protein
LIIEPASLDAAHQEQRYAVSFGPQSAQHAKGIGVAHIIAREITAFK